MAKRQFVSFKFSNLSEIKRQVLNWSTRFDTFSFLDNQQYETTQHSYECLVAAGERAAIQTSAGNAFHELKTFFDLEKDWLFGHFSFELKAETENIPSRLPDRIEFPDLFFFVPEIILIISENRIDIGVIGNNQQEILDAILSSNEMNFKAPEDRIDIKQRISKSDYIDSVRQLKHHILRGDCYEINFCQEFYAEHAGLNPSAAYRSLSSLSPSPFSAYYFTQEKYLLCASPERYLKLSNNKIISQPIKGTALRDRNNPEHDEQLRLSLASSEKDKAENVMVVDLVRNDLSKICETDTVTVSELFGIYSFPQVHQMVSTIEGRPQKNLHWTEMIARTFPMGSMTGAPKRRVLELTEQYEKTKRGLFSGAVGYVKPDQNFDFNVVIRSLLYNQREKYLAYFAGSGITMNSDPESEYEECLAKVAAIESIIKNPSA